MSASIIAEGDSRNSAQNKLQLAGGEANTVGALPKKNNLVFVNHGGNGRGS